MTDEIHRERTAEVPVTGPLTTFVVTGVATPIGTRVVAALAAAHPLAVVRSVDGGCALDELAAICDGADVLVHLAFVADTEWRPLGTERANVDGCRDVLVAATRGGVRHVVLLSSATVYGAWPNNPIPITESAALRPNPNFAYGEQRVQMEHLVLEWQRADDARSTAVLRPVVSMSHDHSGGWLAHALAAAAGARIGELDPPAQFLHVDDLASAVVLAATTRLPGVYNVAPDGWVAGEVSQALAGRTRRVRLPAGFAHHVAVWRWQFQRGPIPTGLLPYTVQPWVVSNDKLRSAGWVPRRTNEQAFVAGTEAKWWTLLSPKRKQELALGGSVVIGMLLALATAIGVRRGLARSATRRSTR